MEKVTPFPSTPGETPTPIDSKNESTQLEDSKNKEKYTNKYGNKS